MSLDFRGEMSVVPHICERAPVHSWILDLPGSKLPSGKYGIQSAVQRVLLEDRAKRGDIEVLLNRKLSVTLNGPLFDSILLEEGWWRDLRSMLHEVNIFLRVCWLKAIAGAWTTTTRMHEDNVWSCIFGCIDTEDCIQHYLVCPILWQLGREALNLREDSIFIGERLCLVTPTADKLRLLAFCHTLYHSLKNDKECVLDDGRLRTAPLLQSRAQDVSRFCKHLVT